MVSSETLQIEGPDGESVPNSFFRQRKKASRLAVIFPGQEYSTHMPMLYLPRLLMQNLGADVLAVHVGSRQSDEFRKMRRRDQLKLLCANADTALSVALEAGSYDRVTLFGKSLGTRILAHLARSNEAVRQGDFIWITPLIQLADVREAMIGTGVRSLAVIGSADPHHDPAAWTVACQPRHIRGMLFKSADHFLEVPGNMRATISVLASFIQALEKFVV